MIGRSGERGSGISVLAARLDDDDDDDEENHCLKKLVIDYNYFFRYAPSDFFKNIIKNYNKNIHKNNYKNFIIEIIIEKILPEICIKDYYSKIIIKISLLKSFQQKYA